MKVQNPSTHAFCRRLFFQSILLPFIMLGSICPIYQFSYLTSSVMHLLLNSILYVMLQMLIHLFNLMRVMELNTTSSYNLQSLKLKNNNNLKKTVKTKIHLKLIRQSQLQMIDLNNFIVKYANLNVHIEPGTAISARYVFLDMIIIAFGQATVQAMQTIDSFIVFCYFRL